MVLIFVLRVFEGAKILSELLAFRHNNFISSEGAEKISYGFYTRKGGVSGGDYSSLNCGIGSDDMPENIRVNRELVAGDIGVQAQNLLSVYQIHSATCISVSNLWSNDARPQGDAMVTDKAGLALGILTADCAPVLFYGQKSDGSLVIGAAHAGWKGALGGVLEATTDAILALGAQLSSIKACVGPCISSSSYEVSMDFCEPFIEHHDESVRFFRSGAKEGSLYFDLPAYCAWRLFQHHVKSITLMDKDTYSDAQNFYSYRRMTHEGRTEYGRQISVISIKE